MTTACRDCQVTALFRLDQDYLIDLVKGKPRQDSEVERWECLGFSSPSSLSCPVVLCCSCLHPLLNLDPTNQPLCHGFGSYLGGTSSRAYNSTPSRLLYSACCYDNYPEANVLLKQTHFEMETNKRRIGTGEDEQTGQRQRSHRSLPLISHLSQSPQEVSSRTGTELSFMRAVSVTQMPGKPLTPGSIRILLAAFLLSLSQAEAKILSATAEVRMNAMQHLVEQLKLEANMEKIKVFQAAAQLQEYSMQNACSDALLVETNNAAIIMKIDKDKRLVVLDEELEGISLDELKDELPERQPHFIVWVPLACKKDTSIKMDNCPFHTMQATMGLQLLSFVAEAASSASSTSILQTVEGEHDFMGVAVTQRPLIVENTEIQRILGGKPNKERCGGGTPGEFWKSTLSFPVRGRRAVPGAGSEFLEESAGAREGSGGCSLSGGGAGSSRDR
ncbi:hypothetical protein GH733_001822 [Mirounga leonina]|nr:hypothetical protein GH733_001822 [Mirounga leonina]